MAAEMRADGVAHRGYGDHHVPKEDLRVREARKAARIVVTERDISYQQALDRVA